MKLNDNIRQKIFSENIIDIDLYKSLIHEKLTSNCFYKQI